MTKDDDNNDNERTSRYCRIYGRGFQPASLADESRARCGATPVTAQDQTAANKNPQAQPWAPFSSKDGVSCQWGVA